MVKKWLSVAGILVVIGGVGAVIAFRNTEASETQTVEHSIDEAFNKIKIKNDIAKLDIKPTNEDTASIELANIDPNEYELKHQVKNNQLQVEVKKKGFKLINFNIKGMTLTVNLPKEAYEELKVKSDDGAIGIRDLQIAQIDVQTDNGATKLEQLTADEINVNSDNGLIQLKDIKADKVSTESDNGATIMEQVNEAEVNSESDNGKITLKTSNVDRPIQLQTDNGAIHIQTDKKPENVTFDIKLGNGKAKVFGSSDWDTKVGNGENLIKLITDNGNITVE